MAGLHRQGVRGYVTLKTLVFPSELPELEATIRQVTEAGVDAVIVQDLGLCRLIREVSPDLEIHASTQMSVTSESGLRLARELGCARVILARELSLEEIARVRGETDMPVEVFVHGALCVAYSGQCLTSEALGGRSANRGECAQACRMPYTLVCDGEACELGSVQYLLSPQDLAAYDLIPRLVELGVSSLKIEGRLKSPEYVANITQHYRRALDAACEHRDPAFTAVDVREMELSFSRGFSHGFLDGNDHKRLVRGEYSKKRGVFLGRVASVTGSGIRLELNAPVKNGDGLVMDADADAGLREQGGRVYHVEPPERAGSRSGGHLGLTEISLGRKDVDLRAVRPGQSVWKTDDPDLTRRLRKTFDGPPRRTLGLDVHVRAETGQPLEIEGRTESGPSVRVRSEDVLARAERLPATEDLFREQLGRLGGTSYHLYRLSAEILGEPLVPKSLLNGLRRELTGLLDQAVAAVPPRRLAPGPVLPSNRTKRDDSPSSEVKPNLSALCRTTAQIGAAAAAGVTTIYADFQDIKLYGEAIACARDSGAKIYLATPRIEKPGEANLFRVLARQAVDGWLVRNAGGLYFCAEHSIPFVADFSWNAANELSVAILLEKGALRVTASYDLNITQLLDLLRAGVAERIEVVVHQRVPMFHMEFCAFSAHLTNGKPHPECGRPCDHHEVKLRDRAGVEHPLKADVGCRNTLFNATPQTAAEFIPQLRSRGASHLRIEFLDEAPDAVGRTLRLYQDVLANRRDPRSLWKELKASNEYGVTRGPLNVLG
jgi:putative protease